MHKDFVYLDQVLPGICWDAKYATWDNFTGAPVCGYEANRVVGTEVMAGALLRVKDKAEELGCGLLLWDGYRPQRAVDSFVQWVQMAKNDDGKDRYYPHIARTSLISQGYIAEKSGHSRGSTIDLTLYRLDTKQQLPMGGNFDLMDPISHHDAEGISSQEKENRRILKYLMEEGGFNSYQYEWWHYTLKDEPFPDIYFDFVIGS